MNMDMYAPLDLNRHLPTIEELRAYQDEANKIDAIASDANADDADNMTPYFERQLNEIDGTSQSPIIEYMRLKQLIRNIETRLNIIGEEIIKHNSSGRIYNGELGVLAIHLKKTYRLPETNEMATLKIEINSLEVALKAKQAAYKAIETSLIKAYEASPECSDVVLKIKPYLHCSLPK